MKRNRGKGLRAGGAIIASLLLALATASSAETLDIGKASRVKAAYLLNFVRYTQWPDASFENPDSPIVLTEVGNCDAAGALSEVVAHSEPIGGRRLVLKQAGWFSGYEPPEELMQLLGQSHLVYVCSATEVQVEALLDQLGSSHVLTVGDTPGFAAGGGMLGFVLKGDRILFEANPKAIQSSGITVSAKVLKLAEIVEGEIP